MIEMRWHRVGVWDGEPHVKINDDGVFVLQYRHRVMVMSDQGTNIRWSEWETVKLSTGDDQ